MTKTSDSDLRAAMTMAENGHFADAALMCIQVIRNLDSSNDEAAIANWLTALYGFKAATVHGNELAVRDKFEQLHLFADNFRRKMARSPVGDEWTKIHVPWEIGRSAILAGYTNEFAFARELAEILKHEIDNGQKALHPKTTVLLVSVILNAHQYEIAEIWLRHVIRENTCPESTAMARLILARMLMDAGVEEEAVPIYRSIFPLPGCQDIAAVAKREFDAFAAPALETVN